MNQEIAIDVNVNCKELDATIEKVKRLNELLQEAQQIINLLSGKEKSKT